MDVTQEAMIEKLRRGECLKCNMGPMRESCAYPASCEHPGRALAEKLNQVLLENRTEQIRLATKSLGTVKNGDVIVVRYLSPELPNQEERRKDYVSIRDYFQTEGVQVRMLGISGTMELDKADDLEMARFGWYKRR